MRTDERTTDGRTDGWTDTKTANMKTLYSDTNVWRGIKNPMPLIPKSDFLDSQLSI